MSKLIQKKDTSTGKQYLGKIQLDELADNIADKNYLHTQSVPSLTWSVSHNLNKYPSVVIKDSSNEEIEGMIIHISINQTVIIFNAVFSGQAIFN